MMKAFSCDYKVNKKFNSASEKIFEKTYTQKNQNTDELEFP